MTRDMMTATHDVGEGVDMGVLERKAGGPDNWLEKVGGLDPYLEEVANAIHTKRGKSISDAIRIAWGMLRRWAAGGSDVNADTRAKAAKSVANMEAKRARNRGLALSADPRIDLAEYVDLASPTDEAIDEFVLDLAELAQAEHDEQLEALDLAPGDYRPPYDWKHGYVPLTPAAAASKAKQPPWAGKGGRRKGAPPGTKIVKKTKAERRLESAAAQRLAKAKDDEQRGRATPGEAQAAQNAVNASGPRRTLSDAAPEGSAIDKARKSAPRSIVRRPADHAASGAANPAGSNGPRTPKAMSDNELFDALTAAGRVPYSEASGVDWGRLAALSNERHRRAEKGEGRFGKLKGKTRTTSAGQLKEAARPQPLGENPSQRPEVKAAKAKQVAERARVAKMTDAELKAAADKSNPNALERSNAVDEQAVRAAGKAPGGSEFNRRQVGDMVTGEQLYPGDEFEHDGKRYAVLADGHSTVSRGGFTVDGGPDTTKLKGTVRLTGRSEQKAAGPTPAEKVKNAETMFGTGSKQHVAAITAYNKLTELEGGPSATPPSRGDLIAGKDTDRRPTDRRTGAVDSTLPNRSDESATDRRAQERAVERRDYDNAEGPVLADAAADRGLIGRERARQKSDPELRKLLKDADDRTAASQARGPSSGASPGARTEPPSSSTTSTNPDAPIRIEHGPDGTLVQGTSREDAAAIKAVGGFKWSRNLGAWYLPRTWGEATREQRVRQLEAKLGDKAGVDRTTGPRKSAAERDAEKRERAEGRAERMESRAEKQSAEADRRFKASDLREENSGIPFGQPILVGHHSERKHRRTLERAHANLGKGVEAQREAERASEAAERARRTAAGTESKRTIGNRVAKNEADLRDVDRKLDGTSSQLRGPATGEYRDRLLARKADLEDTIGYDKGKLEAAGGVPSKDTVSPGDFVKIRGQWYPVRKANAKTVSHPHWTGSNGTSPWHEVDEHRKAADVTRADVGRMIQETSQAFPGLKTELAKAAPAKDAGVTAAREAGQSAGAATPAGITDATARKMTDDQLERAMQRLMADGTYSGPAFGILERELNRRDAARAEGNRRGR